MVYTAVELFMEKLKQLIFNSDNPLIANHPLIISERPRFQLLYEELVYVIQIFLLIDEDHQPQQVKDLKKKFKDAADNAHDVIDQLVYNLNLNHPSDPNTQPDPNIQPKRTMERHFAWHTWPSSYSGCGRSTKMVREEEEEMFISVNLDDVMASIKSIKKDFLMIYDTMKVDSSLTTAHIKAGPLCTKNPLGTTKASEDVVGFDRHVELIRDKLVEDQKNLDIVSIVGMGGMGKTTLAAKVFNDPFFLHHFHIRGWVTVSQSYDKQDLLIQILESIGNKRDDVSNHDYSRLRLMLRQQLMGRRYLIVVDDVWSAQAWDALKMSFPDDNNGSRILLTSRLNEVASHAKPHSFVHPLEYLTEEESWKLLCKKVFHGTTIACPEWLVESGMKIAKSCHGLPLTLVVVAGALAKVPLTKDSWEKFGRSVRSYIVNEQTNSIDQLGLSIDHLPGHLRDCFLYLGGFPEDFKFQVRKLIWLWMAEGFILEDGHRSLEEIGEDYFIELVDRNLVFVAGRKSNGSIKDFSVHDLLRELCLKVATKEKFYHKEKDMTVVFEAYHRRVFTEHDIGMMIAPRTRSFLCNKSFEVIERHKWPHRWMLLMVLAVPDWKLRDFPEEMSQLVHLRYLEICFQGEEFPTTICKLWSLQTLVITYKHGCLKLPTMTSNLVNLRHLNSKSDIIFSAVEKPLNLQTISTIVLDDVAESWGKCLPSVKQLSCRTTTLKECDLESLSSTVEHLKLSRFSEYGGNVTGRMKLIGLPTRLKSLALHGCRFPWSDMSIIQALPNLEVLKLLYHSFSGPLWDAGVDLFPKLEFLKLCSMDVKNWEASSINFPCLKMLVVSNCLKLEEIPLDFGSIPTLELIQINGMNRINASLMESVRAIEEDQLAQGNSELKITIRYGVYK